MAAFFVVFREKAAFYFFQEIKCMNIELIESAMVSHLKENIKEAEITGFVQLPEVFEPDEQCDISICTRFIEENIIQSKTIPVSVMKTTVKMGVALLARELCGKKGMYEYIEKVKHLLNGYEIQGCTGLRHDTVRFVGRYEAHWVYDIIFLIEVKLPEEEQEIVNPFL